jgi:hypothetical protein
MHKNFLSSALLPIFLMTAALPGHAQPCTNNDFKGVYSATVLGDFMAPPPGVPAGPTARVGLVRPDGINYSLVTATLSLDGTIMAEDYGGTYEIRPDCVASVILQIPFPGAPAPVPFHFTGVLASNGEMMNLILVDPQGTNIRITLHKQRNTSCTTDNLSGDYALSLSGTLVSSTNTPSGFASVGMASFDGAGNLTASVNTSYGGLIQPETFSGTYTMDPNCSFHATLNGSSQLGWFGVMADTVLGANLIVTAPGAVVTGTLTTVY